MKRVLIAVLLLLPVFASAQSTLTCPNLTRPLVFGMRDISSGGEVGRLQLFLADYYGLSHADIVTGYFGPLTRATVRRFQCEKLSICAGSEYESGYGFVGRLTRAAIQSSCNATVSTPPTDTDPAPQCELTVSPARFVAGESVRVSWTSRYATAGAITPGIGTVGPNGSIRRTLDDTTRFEGEFVAASGRSGLCSVTARLSTDTASSSLCTFNGISMASSTSVTAYESQAVASGVTCRGETRTCGNGTLSGTYQYTSCTVGETTTVSTTSGFPYPNVQVSGYPGLQGVSWLNLEITPPSPYTDASYDVTRTVLLVGQSLLVDFGDGTKRMFNYNEGDTFLPMQASGQIWVQMTHRYSRAGTYTVKWYYQGNFLAQGTYTQP